MDELNSNYNKIEKEQTICLIKKLQTDLINEFSPKFDVLMSRLDKIEKNLFNLLNPNYSDLLTLFGGIRPAILDKNYVFIEHIKMIAKALNENKNIYRVDIESFFEINEEDAFNQFKDTVIRYNEDTFMLSDEFLNELENDNNKSIFYDKLRTFLPLTPRTVFFMSNEENIDKIEKMICPQASSEGFYAYSCISHGECDAFASYNEDETGGYFPIFVGIPLRIFECNKIQKIGFKEILDLLYNGYKNDSLDRYMTYDEVENQFSPHSSSFDYNYDIAEEYNYSNDMVELLVKAIYLTKEEEMIKFINNTLDKIEFELKN